MQKQAANHRIEHTKLVVLGNLHAEYLRKCTEFVFRGSSAKIEIFTKEKASYMDTIEKGTHKSERIFIKAEGKRYADILRSIKSSVNIDEVGIKVKSIKKAAKVEVML